MDDACNHLSDIVEADIKALYDNVVPGTEWADYILEHMEEIRREYCTYDCSDRYSCLVNKYTPKDKPECYLTKGKS